MAKARRASSQRTPSSESVGAGAATSEPPGTQVSTIEAAPPLPKARARKKPATSRTPKKRAPANALPVEPTIAPVTSEESEPRRLLDAERSAKAEVLALLAESDQHPVQDAIETPARYDVLPSLYARLEALVLLAETAPQETTQAEAPFSPPEIAAFDPFETADLADEAPFDPPDESDLGASATVAQEDKLTRDVEPERIAAENEPLAPMRAPAPAPGPANRDYLERARRAARDQTSGQPHRLLFGVPVENIERHKWRIVGASIAPLLAASTWALLAQSESDRDAAPVTVQAGVTASSARDLVGQYRTAMQRIENDRVREGVASLRDLAEAGFPMAQYQLAKVLERGEGAAQSLAQARLWTERAANGGNCRAMHDVGVFYARGEGVARDEAIAARWFRAAAERGVADSQYNLGILFEQGRGVALDPKEALFWFVIAARNRDLNAIDRAVGVAAGLSATEVAQVQARARSFELRTADPIANGAFDGAAAQSCAAGS